MSFLDNFKNYDGCMEPGVKLPKLKISKKFYTQLNIDQQVSNFEFLSKICEKGLKDKQITNKDNESEYRERLEYELNTLEELGFTDYILLNWDIINFCHENQIPTGPGRGSAAGSLVLFLINVTKIDPIENELFFERFVSKSRARKIESNGEIYLDGSLLADVDNDIAYEYRHLVVEYIEKKHPGRTAKILTLNTLSSKLCLKECIKIVGDQSEQDANRVSDMIPKKFGKVASIDASIEESEDFHNWSKEFPGIVKIAQKIQNLNKNTGVHPSGIAISHKAISEVCPVFMNSEGQKVTGYDMNWVAELMVKFDILGLRTLSVLHNTAKQVGIELEEIDVHSEDVYLNLQDLISPRGLFQIEADTDFKVCKKIKPKNLEELSAVLAIARPGALDFLSNYETYVQTGNFQSVHPIFDEILDYTGGIPLYQEQLMKMAVRVGFTLDESEQLRRIVGKKKVDKMAEWKEKIFEKIKSNKLTNKDLNREGPDAGEVLWRVAEDSANYSFNKSHSIAYSTLAAWTTYLKFKYPIQFFLSLLNMTKFEPSPQEEVGKISKELSYFGIKLLPPNLSKSEMDFSIEGKNIRYGLNSIKGISEKALKSLIEFRSESGDTKYEMFISAKQAGLNIGTLCALIQAGALSHFEGSRPLLVLEAQVFNILTDREKRNFIQLGEKYDYKLLDAIVAARDKNLVGDDGRPLFKESRFQTFKKKYEPYKNIYMQNSKSSSFANWYFENQLLGYSYSEDLRNIFSKPGLKLTNLKEYQEKKRNANLSVIGIVNDCFTRVSRSGNKYMKLEISDEFGSLHCMLCNNSKESKLDEFLSTNQAPEKNSIIVTYGSKADDIFFVNNINVLNENIYMKLADLK